MATFSDTVFPVVLAMIPPLMVRMIVRKTIDDNVSILRGFQADKLQPGITGADVITGLLGLASYLVWLHGGLITQILPLGLYFMQLMAQVVWQRYFYQNQQLGLAITYLVIALLLSMLTSYFFSLSSYNATVLTLPHLLWTAWMTYSTWTLWDVKPVAKVEVKETIRVRDVREPIGVDDRRARSE